MSSQKSSEAETSSNAERYIRFRLTAIDTVQADTKSYPSSDAEKADVPFLYRFSPFFGPKVQLAKTPEVRIWGATDQGQRCCVHVQGALPYMYIEYQCSLDPEVVQKYINQLGKSLNLAMFYSFRGRNRRANFDPHRDQYIPYIVLCKGVPFYGFHVGYRYFLKIYCLHPQYMRRLGEILKAGAVLKKGNRSQHQGPNVTSNSTDGTAEALPASAQTGHQIYEAHIPFLLQFMLDFNLYGCGWVELSHCMFRGNLPLDDAEELGSSNLSNSSTKAARLYSEATVPASKRFREGDPRRISPNSALELDCHVSSILNRLAVEPRNLHQDFTEFLEHPIPDDAKLVHSVKGVWDDEKHRRKERGEKGPFEEPEPSASQRKYQQGETPEWAMSKHFRPIFESMLEDDRKRYMAHNPGKWPPDFRTFVTKPVWDQWIPTTFQSVESLFPSTMERDETLGRENPYGVWAAQGIGTANTSRAASAEPTGGVDAKALQELAKQVEQQEQSYTSSEQSDDDDRLIDPAQYHEDNASEADEENEPLVDDEDLDRAQLWGRDTSDHNTPVPDSDIDDRPPEPERQRSQKSLRELEAPVEASTGQDRILSDVAEDQTQREFPLSGIDFNTSDMFTSSPTIDFEPPHLSRGVIPKVKGQGPRNLFASSRPRPSSRSPTPEAVEPSSWAVDQRPGHFNDNDDIYTEEVGPAPSSKEEGLRKDRAATEPLYNLSSSSSQSFRNSSTPVKALTMESSAFDVLSPTQLVTDTAIPPKRRRSEDPHDITEMHRARKCVRVEGAAANHAHEEFQFAYKLTQNSTSSKSSQTSSQTHWKATLFSDRLFSFQLVAPTTEELLSSMVQYSRFDGLRHRPMAQIRYQEPYYSTAAEVPHRPQEFAGAVFKISGKGPRWLSAFPHSSGLSREPGPKSSTDGEPFWLRVWEYALPPPSRRACIQWLETTEGSLNQPMPPRNRHRFSQIHGGTQVNPFGFKYTQFATAKTSSAREKEHMNVLALELQCASRGDKMSDPDEDEILALFYCLYSDSYTVTGTQGARENCLVGCLAQNSLATSQFDEATLHRLGLGQYSMEFVDSELEIINSLVDKVIAWDPEVFCGFEIQNASWGYLLERAQKEYDIPLIKDLSRVIEQSTGRNEGKLDAWHYTKSSTIKITGRHVLPIWRLLKSDVNLLQYTFENVVFHILHLRTPHYSQQTLYRWMSDGVVRHLAQVFEYWLRRVEMDLALLEDAEVISNKTEFARIYGVDFASVINRGSQFKVESVMFRIAKPESFLLLSPSREEVGRQNALEAMPLIAEPKSAFYKDPVVVLDFQSLYPSVMIGYNYCYSTCLGRVGKFKGTPKFGVINLYLPDGLLWLLKDHITISPNGFMFVKPVLRRSLLAKMLSELLSTRVMVKNSMKLIKNDKGLMRVYNARQLGLKLLANVTYGYTSATFSGRMPCSEIADAIVQTGRESLERARKIIHEHREWGADVVYGDTDSLFVWLPGKTKDNAFSIGYDMADKITSTNVAPVKLKFEKVYLPSVLASKKRYVGFKFEMPDEEEAVLDAKGIETIRRDGFPAVQKMVEASIRILFKTQDLSKVKSYCEQQWSKFVKGSISPQDFIFAKEVRPGSYSENGIPPPGAVIARNRVAKDHRDEVQYAERVPYIIPEPYGGQTRLVDRALEPHQFLESDRHRIDAKYYIKFTIAALNRVFTLLGVNTADWAMKMPKVYRVAESRGTAPSTLSQMPINPSKTTIDKFYRSDRCLSCGAGLEDTSRELCPTCVDNPAMASYQLMQQASESVARRNDLHKICSACTGHPQAEGVACDSIACPVYFARKMNERSLPSSSGRVIDRTWSLQAIKEMSSSV